MPLKGVLAIFQKTLRNGGRGTEYRAGGGRRRLRLIAVSFGLALLSLFLYFHYFIFISRKKNRVVVVLLCLVCYALGLNFLKFSFASVIIERIVSMMCFLFRWFFIFMFQLMLNVPLLKKRMIDYVYTFCLFCFYRL